MYNLDKKFSKIIMFKKITHMIIEDMKCYKSDNFYKFLDENQCKGILKNENIDKYGSNSNIEELKSHCRNDGYVVFDHDEWNAYDALDNFLERMVAFPYDIDFENLWIKMNSKRINEDIFKEIENVDIGKNQLLELLEKIIEDELDEYSYLSQSVLCWIVKSKIYLREKIESIFELNYFINYKKEKQLEILDSTINYIYALFENDKKLNLKITKELESIFSINNLEKKILEEVKELLNEKNTYYGQMVEFKKIINIFHYDVVIEDKYLKELTNFYYNFISLTATIIVLKRLKSNKKDRVIKQIDIYLEKEAKYKLIFNELKKRLNFYEKNITSGIIELFYKELMDEQLDVEEMINKMHRSLYVNKKTLLDSKKQISNEIVFNEKVASFCKLLIKN